MYMSKGDIIHELKTKKNPWGQMQKIADQCQCSFADINQIAKEAGLNIKSQPKNGWSEEELINIFRLRKQGYGISDISAIYGRSRHAVINKLSRVKPPDADKPYSAHISGSVPRGRLNNCIEEDKLR